MAPKLFGVYRQQSTQMLKFSIYADKEELFEQLALQSLQIAVQATEQKTISDIYQEYAVFIDVRMGPSTVPRTPA